MITKLIKPISPVTTVFAEKTLVRMFPGLTPRKVKWTWVVVGRVLEADFRWEGEDYSSRISIDGEMLA
jgi:hypothetical protein